MAVHATPARPKELRCDEPPRHTRAAKQLHLSRTIQRTRRTVAGPAIRLRSRNDGTGGKQEGFVNGQWSDDKLDHKRVHK